MVRVTYGAPRRKKKVRWFKAAKGGFGGRSKLWRIVREHVMRAWAYSFRDRRQRKRHFRRLWVIRINAAARMCDLSYSRLINGLKKAGVAIDRKVLADIAVHDMDAFRQLADRAKQAQAA